MIAIQVKVSDTVTPTLARLEGRLTDRTDLHRRIGTAAEVLTRRHIIEVAAPARHTTAERLGASPTGYLARRGQAVESSANRDAAIVTLGGAREIFARVDGPVIVAGRGKLLTIPATAPAYGRRAGEFSNLRFVLFPSGAKALVKSKTARGGPHRVRHPEAARSARPARPRQAGDRPEVMFWLKDQVTLPQDRGLLPADEQFAQAAEIGARDYIKEALE